MPGERRTYQSAEQTRREILEVLKDGKDLFSRDIADALNIVSQAVRSELRTMTKAGLLDRSGPFQTTGNSVVTSYKYTLARQGRLDF